MLEQLLIWDEQLFHWINSGWSNSFLDWIYPYWRSKSFWIPLYIILVGLLSWRYKWGVWPILLTIAITMVLSDMTSSHLIKKSVQRLRPCNALEDIRILIHCGSGYSFTSSHATNHFALSTILWRFFQPVFPSRWLPVVLYFWAASIALGQVYVGVHYPLDITCGALLGILIASFTGWIYSIIKKGKALA